MRSPVAAVLVAVVLATGACDDDPADPGHPTDADVEGRAFTSTEVEGFVSTLMGCPDDRARQDAAVQDFLTGGPAMTLDGDVLTLTGRGITLTAREQP